jgi:hypothetical protein
LSRRSAWAAAHAADDAIVLAGRVRWDDGTPAAGALVLALGVRERSDGGTAGPAAFDAWTNKDGQFRLTCPGVDWVTVDVMPPDRAAKVQKHGSLVLDRIAGRRRFTRASPPTAADLDFVVPRGKTISGQVVDHEGRPLAGAQVGVLNVRTSLSGPDHVGDAVTDSSGRFVIAHVRDRFDQRVWASAPGFALGDVSPVKPGASNVRISLRRGGAVAGRVLAMDGKPATAFTIELVALQGVPRHDHPFARESMRRVNATSELPAGMGEIVREVQSASGAFDVSGIRPGAYDLIVRGKDGAAGQIEDVTIADNKVDGLSVRIGEVAVRGRVIDARTGKPLAGVSVEPLRLDDGGTSPAMTNRDGTFVLPRCVPGKSIVISTRPAPGDDGHVGDHRMVRVPASSARADIGDLRLLPGRREPRGTPDVGIQPGPSLEGVVIEWIRPGSPADEAKLVAGDYLERIDKTPLAGLGPFAAQTLLAGRARTRVTIAVRKHDGTRTTVTLARKPAE